MADDPPLLMAATILLVREAPDLEVLMVERHHQIDFASGALVFPGGKSAETDHPRFWDGHVHGAEATSAALDGLKVAAIREAFEESGLLIARHAAHEPQNPLVLPGGFPETSARRAAIAAGTHDFRLAVGADGLALALDQLTLFAHWVTPKGMPKRFDTYFFIAAAPPGQWARHDGHEAVDAVWLTPKAALAAATAGARKIIFPTRLNLELLDRSNSVDAAISAARERTLVRVEPEISRQDGVLMLSIPEEAGYGAICVPLTEAT
jgi:8-oxo-dGTP pyrophosphatase MutT (NUDIX family)